MVPNRVLQVMLCMLLLTVSIWTIAILGKPTGSVSGTTTANVVNITSVTLTVSNVSFGSIVQGSSDDTSDSSPAPLVLENTGSNRVNVTINATSLFSTEPNPSDSYRFMVGNGTEGLCYGNSTLTSWTDMPLGATLAIVRMNNSDACDNLRVHINVSVPSGEPVGAKASTITFIATES